MSAWGYYVGEDGYYYPSVGAWPWYSVGQQPPPRHLPPPLPPQHLPPPLPGTPPPMPRPVPMQPGMYDPTQDPNWRGARALVRSTIQQVLGSDAMFDQIFRQVVQHLLRQGFLDRQSAAQLSRSENLAKARNRIRQMTYYMDLDALIDLGARQVVQALRAM